MHGYNQMQFILLSENVNYTNPITITQTSLQLELHVTGFQKRQLITRIN